MLTVFEKTPISVHNRACWTHQLNPEACFVFARSPQLLTTMFTNSLSIQLVCLRLPRPVCVPHLSDLTAYPSLRSALLSLKAENRVAYVFGCLEDPSFIYLISEAPDSVHVPEKIALSQEGDQHEEQITMEYNLHILPLRNQHMSTSLLTMLLSSETPTISINRHLVKPGADSSFLEAYTSNVHELTSFIGGRQRVVGGWGTAVAAANDEPPSEVTDGKHNGSIFVLFTGWRSKEHHFEFAATEAFERYKNIMEYIEGADIKHAFRLHL